MIWQPLPLGEAVELFAGAPFRWWISGGTALELHLQQTWRTHGDLDIGICRADAVDAVRWLTGWSVWIASDGDLTPWDGAPVTANNLWVTDQPGNPWRLDLTVGGGDDAFWWYRRDPSVRLPWSEAVIETSDGVAYLAPHIQLLFKAKAPRTKDDVDLRQVAPHLTARQRDWLAQRLAADHP